MKKQTTLKLNLTRETLQSLEKSELGAVAGGVGVTYTTCNSRCC